MLRGKLLSQKDKLMRSNGLLKFGIVVFGISSVISSVSAYQSRHYIRTVVTPSQMFQKYEVTNDWMDDQGMKAFSRDALDLFLNYNKETVEDRFYDFMKMVLLKNYSNVKAELEDELRVIDRLNIVSSFLPETYITNRKNRIISAIGLRRKESGGKLIFDGIERWNIYFQIVEAKFKINRITKSTNIRKVPDAKN